MIFDLPVRAIGFFCTTFTMMVSLTAVPARAQVVSPPQPPAGVIQPSDINGYSWPADEIVKAQARCAQVLKGLAIVAKPLPPVRDHECGSPAPLELTSIGRSPAVVLSPPVIVTCDMAAAMHRWVKDSVQPLARKHLGGEVVRIETMSSYSCRTAYGRKDARLSEHGKANAIDIRAFFTAAGVGSVVLADWGLTGREIAVQVAAAKKYEAEHPRANATASATASAALTQRGAPLPSTVVTGSIGLNGSNGSVPGISIATPQMAVGTRDGTSIGLHLPSPSDTGLGLSNTFGAQSRLGGPAATADSGGPDSRTFFLRGAHDAACAVFGTVLGPEANAAHRNHFHVDMAERKVKSICE